MFTSITHLLTKLFTDLQHTFIWIFTIGLLFCAIMVWAGDETSAPKFKKGLILSLVGLVVFLLAKPIITYVQGGL